MSKLRLGPIADEKPVKLTLELSGRLYRDLTDYASAHAEETGLAAPLALDRIAPAMLERFIATDRGFAKSRRRHWTGIWIGNEGGATEKSATI